MIAICLVAISLSSSLPFLGLLGVELSKYYSTLNTITQIFLGIREMIGLGIFFYVSVLIALLAAFFAVRKKRRLSFNLLVEENNKKLFYVDKSLNCPIPRTYWIEINTSCNLNCPFCPTSTGVYYNDIKMMSYETYSNIFDKIKDHAMYIYLHKHGEPTLNKDLLKIIKLTSSYGRIYTLFSTNFNTIKYDERKAEDLVLSGISEIIASIDGVSEESYRQYRRGGTFEKAFTNLKALADAKKRLKSQTPKLNWQYLVNRHNEHEVYEAQKLAKEIGVEIYFLLMDVWQNESWISSYHRDPSKLFELNRDTHTPQNHQTVTIAEVFSSTPAQKELPIDTIMHIDHVKIHGHFPWWCAQVFHTMSINTDGTLAPCTEIADSRFNLGNILTTSVEELWNSDGFKKSRHYILNKDVKGALCESCVRGEQKMNGDISLIEV